MLTAVTWAAIAAAAVLLVSSMLYQWVVERPARVKADTAIDTVNEALNTLGPSTAAEASPQAAANPQEQSAVGDALKSALEGLATFAQSLTTLDKSTRGYLITALFLIIAVVAASIAEVA